MNYGKEFGNEEKDRVATSQKKTSKLVNVLKVKRFLWIISLFLGTREQAGKTRLLLNQPNVCLCTTNLMIAPSVGAKLKKKKVCNSEKAIF